MALLREDHVFTCTCKAHSKRAIWRRKRFIAYFLISCIHLRLS